MIQEPSEEDIKKAVEEQKSEAPSSEVLGAVKIKDGIFLGDEYASQVSYLKSFNLLFSLGLGICRCE